MAGNKLVNRQSSVPREIEAHKGINIDGCLWQAPPGWIGLLIGLAAEVVKESVREGLKASVAAEKKELVKQLKDYADRNRKMRVVIEELNKALEFQHDDLLETRRERDRLYIKLITARMRLNPEPIPSVEEYDEAIAEDTEDE